MDVAYNTDTDQVYVTFQPTPIEGDPQRDMDNLLRAELKESHIPLDNTTAVLDWVADKLQSDLFQTPTLTAHMSCHYIRAYHQLHPSANTLELFKLISTDGIREIDYKTLTSRPRLYHIYVACRKLSRSALLFYGDMEKFLVQAVCGVIIAPLRRGLGRDLNLSVYGYIKYLNACWHGYHRNTDPFVVKHFKAILQHERIKGSICLMHWLKNLGLRLLNQMNIDTVVNIDVMRELTFNHLKSLFVILMVGAGEIECAANAECKDDYDPTDDFFHFGSPSQ